jgi:dephospho-CoA kinase
MPSIGLTGNFGMGKTTVLKLFEKHGVQAISSDDLVHDILKKPAIIRKLSRILGNKVLIKGPHSLSINKKVVADEIFADAEKRRLVESVIHPEVLKSINKIKSALSKKSRDSIIVFEVPLLFEAGFESLFDINVTVYCKRDTAIRRLLRKGWTETDAIKRIRAQMPVTRKKRLADLLINNERDISSTEKRVRLIIRKLRNVT